MSDVSSAAIVGLNWGLVHLRGLRAAGCEVVALSAADEHRAREVAERESVPRWTSDVASLNELDLVVVATPAATHAEVLRQLPRPFLVCEKPLLGLTGSAADLPDTTGRMFVNYAFAFLRTARAVAEVVDGRGRPDRVALAVDVALPLGFSPQAWFMEAASHPLSWLLHLFGAPHEAVRSSWPDSHEVVMRAGDVPIAARLRIGGEPGIHQHITMHWGSEILDMRGRYRPGKPWRYDPVTLDGLAITEGEWSATDCWLDANAAAMQAMVEVFRGRRPWSEGTAAGLFDAQRALWLERAVRDDPGSPETWAGRRV